MNERRPTPQDVARFHNGEMTDEQEIQGLMEWVEKDPKVRARFDYLDVESALEEIAGKPLWDPPTPEQVAEAQQVLGNLIGSRITPIELSPRDRRELYAGETVQGHVTFPPLGDNPKPYRVNCEFTPLGDGNFALHAPKLPRGVELVNITAADLKLSEPSSMSPRRASLRIDWQKSEVDAYLATQAGKGEIEVQPPANRGDVMIDDNQKQPTDLKSETAKSLAAKSVGGSICSVEAVKNKNAIRVQVPVQSGRSHELLRIEMRYPTRASREELQVGHLCVTEIEATKLGRYFVGELLVPLQFGTELRGNGANVTFSVGLASLDDIALLNNEVCSELLAVNKTVELPVSRLTDAGLYFVEAAPWQESMIDKTWHLRWKIGNGSNKS